MYPRYLSDKLCGQHYGFTNTACLRSKDAASGQLQYVMVLIMLYSTVQYRYINSRTEFSLARSSSQSKVIGLINF
jgi:hypothetical protein